MSGKYILKDTIKGRGRRNELRPVEFWTCNKEIKYKGFFHTWGQRRDENLAEFFGVVEDELGACIELDAIQIKFIMGSNYNIEPEPDGGIQRKFNRWDI